VKVHVCGSDVVAAMDVVVDVTQVEELVAAAAAENKT